MRHVLSLVDALALGGGLPAADIPDGSSATITAMQGYGALKIAAGTRVYYLPLHEIVGVQAKSNGCSVTMRTDKGVETRDFTISAEELMDLVRLATVK
jgi:hypothetical protein